MSDEEDVEENGTAGSSRCAPPDLAPAGPSRDVASSSRRDENPFSLRHFLRGGGGGSGVGAYEQTGARPKTYAVPPASPERARAAPPPLVLPDFVQDHLLTESPPPQPLHQLSLDLTESVPRVPPPQHSSPLDLPHLPEGSGGGLPDFLPTHRSRASADFQQKSHLHTLFNNTRLELSESRELARRLEHETDSLRTELQRRSQFTCAACGSVREESETELQRLRAELQRLQESEGAWRRRAEESAARASAAGRDLRRVTDAADTTLRDLFQRLATLSSELDPP